MYVCTLLSRSRIYFNLSDHHGLASKLTGHRSVRSRFGSQGGLERKIDSPGERSWSRTFASVRSLAPARIAGSGNRNTKAAAAAAADRGIARRRDATASSPLSKIVRLRGEGGKGGRGERGAEVRAACLDKNADNSRRSIGPIEMALNLPVRFRFTACARRLLRARYLVASVLRLP